MGNVNKLPVSCVETVSIPKRLKDSPSRLPWPRLSEDSPHVQLGIDVNEKRNDIIKIVHKFFKLNNVSMDELLQEVYVAILHKNRTRSAHDPRKSSFGHYVYMIAHNVCANIANKMKRREKEKESIYAPSGGDEGRSILETTEDLSIELSKDDTLDLMKNVENMLSQNGMWAHIRYIRLVNSGANPDIIKEALSFGNRQVSSKNIKEIRNQIRNIIDNECC